MRSCNLLTLKLCSRNDERKQSVYTELTEVIYFKILNFPVNCFFAV
jgi:hypothetical protein